jgi:hypothetical protein
VYGQTFALHGEMDRKRVIATLTKLALHVSPHWEVTVARHEEKRTDRQNGFLHAVLRDIADQCPDRETGELLPVEAWKEYFAREFLPTRDVTMPDGVVVTVRTNTSTLGREAFSGFLSKIEEWCAMRPEPILLGPEARDAIKSARVSK